MPEHADLTGLNIWDILEQGPCILTDENIATEDDCTTHDHEPFHAPEPDMRCRDLSHLTEIGQGLGYVGPVTDEGITEKMRLDLRIAMMPGGGHG